MKIPVSKSGFTLIEAVIFVAIASMIAYGVFLVAHSGVEQLQTTEFKINIQNSAREALYKMVQELRQSSPTRVTISGGGDTIQFNVPHPQNALDGSYKVNWIGSHLIQYARGGANNRQVIRTNLTTGTTTVLANNAANLDFTGNGANPTLVAVNIGVQRTLTNGRFIPAQPLQVMAQAEIRN